MTLVINFLAGSGAKKTTLAMDISAELKWFGGINIEYVGEYVKPMVFEERKSVFKNQDYIFGKQYYNVQRLTDCGKLDVIVTDSPIILGILYNRKNKGIDLTFEQNILNRFNEFNNINYFVQRVKPFQQIGRHQTEQEARADDIELKDILKEYNIDYTEIKGEKASTEIIANQIKSMVLAQKQAEAWKEK